jgi:hypothetical protein
MIPTVQSIRRVRQFQDRRREKATQVIAAMADGASLNLTFTKSGSVFTLSNGTRVPPEIAVMVINDIRIISGTDGLFPSLPQTWKHVDRFF